MCLKAYDAWSAVGFIWNNVCSSFVAEESKKNIHMNGSVFNLVADWCTSSVHINTAWQNVIWGLFLTWKGIVRLIFSPTFLMYFVLRSRGRRIFGCSKAGWDFVLQPVHCDTVWHLAFRKPLKMLRYDWTCLHVLFDSSLFAAQPDSPIISRMVTGCDIVAGGLRPAMFTATTLKLIFSPTGRPRTTYPCLSQRSWFATTQLVSEIKVNNMVQAIFWVRFESLLWLYGIW